MDRKREGDETPEKSRDQSVARGLTSAHDAIGTNFLGLQRLSAHVYALTEGLIAKQLIGLRELEERKQHIEQQMMEEMKTKWVGARQLADDRDKYDPERTVLIDCPSRVHLCKAACCKLGFYLSRQDLEEGVVRWDFGEPYHIAQGENGYCVHLDAEKMQCGVHESRPFTCRAYDCRSDKRIWKDFEARIPNPELDHPDWGQRAVMGGSAPDAGLPEPASHDGPPSTD